MRNRVRLAIQKKGRLHEDSIDLLEKCGLHFSYSDRTLSVEVQNFDIEIIFLRSGDIPEILHDKIADIGICGQNTVIESMLELKELKKLKFGKCLLSLAYPNKYENFSYQGKKIATSYPKILKKYLQEKKIDATIIPLSGSVELAPKLNIADAICDLVSSGNTLRRNGLKEDKIILRSEAGLFVKSDISEVKNVIIQKLIERINAVLNVETKKYIIMNAPQKKLDNIKKNIPSLQAPTVSKLLDSNSVSVASVIKEEYLWDTVEKLKDSGATDILVLSIDKIID